MPAVPPPKLAIGRSSTRTASNSSIYVRATEESLGGSAWDKIDGLTTRLELRLAMLRTPVMFGPDAELQWHG
ncbi:MAG: hypothetical protein U0744_15595 [Gemmataceae bacterium]